MIFPPHPRNRTAIMNKKTLAVFPYPWILSWIQIAVGAVFMLIMWKLRIFKPPEGGFTKDMFKALLIHDYTRDVRASYIIIQVHH